MMQTNLLEKDGYRLRAPEIDDLPFVYAIENDTALWSMNEATGPFSKQQLENYIRFSSNDIRVDKQIRFLVERVCDKVPVAIVDVFNYVDAHQRAEVGITVAPTYRRQGIASIALTLLERHCFDFLGMHQLVAYVFEDNYASRKLFIKMGYAHTANLKDWMHVGREGHYQDVRVYQKIALTSLSNLNK